MDRPSSNEKHQPEVDPPTSTPHSPREHEADSHQPDLSVSPPRIITAVNLYNRRRRPLFLQQWVSTSSQRESEATTTDASQQADLNASPPEIKSTVRARIINRKKSVSSSASSEEDSDHCSSGPPSPALKIDTVGGTKTTSSSWLPEVDHYPICVPSPSHEVDLDASPPKVIRTADVATSSISGASLSQPIGGEHITRSIDIPSTVHQQGVDSNPSNLVNSSPKIDTASQGDGVTLCNDFPDASHRHEVGSWHHERRLNGYC